jgi:4-hydroxy-tetrahydrodipicolinate synthase
MPLIQSASSTARAATVAALRVDPLWAPLLTHYDHHGAVDLNRMRAQIRSLTGQIDQFLLAGTTGDGWEMSDEALSSLVALTRERGVRLLFGVLRGKTDAVIRAASQLEAAVDASGQNTAAVGLTLCPPVDRHASQAQILEHFGRILAVTRLPVAVYQLPQITGCEIEPDTMRQLLDHPRVLMFKDTSGSDRIVSAAAADSVVRLRGAEGGYARARIPRGGYDGWLVSSGNAVPETLRMMVNALEAGRIGTAEALSERLDRIVARLFAAAGVVPFGNPFSNANRAADHVRAHGRRWREAPIPRTISGAPLPVSLLSAAFDTLEADGLISATGYLDQVGGQVG